MVVARTLALTAEALIEHCRQHLTGYKVPRGSSSAPNCPKAMSAKSCGAYCGMGRRDAPSLRAGTGARARCFRTAAAGRAAITCSSQLSAWRPPPLPVQFQHHGVRHVGDDLGFGAIEAGGFPDHGRRDEHIVLRALYQDRQPQLFRFQPQRLMPIMSSDTTCDSAWM